MPSVVIQLIIECIWRVARLIQALLKWNDLIARVWKVQYLLEPNCSSQISTLHWLIAPSFLVCCRLFVPQWKHFPYPYILLLSFSVLLLLHEIHFPTQKFFLLFLLRSSFLCQKYIFLLQIFSSFRSPFFILLHQIYFQSAHPTRWAESISGIGLCLYFRPSSPRRW